MSSHDRKNVPEVDIEAAGPMIAPPDAAAVPDAKEKRTGGLKAPAKVLVYHEACWDDVDLEKQQGDLEAPAAVHGKTAGHFAWWDGRLALWRNTMNLKLAAAKETDPRCLNRRKLILIAALLVVVVVLALGLGVGLGTNGPQATAGTYMQQQQQQTPDGRDVVTSASHDTSTVSSTKTTPTTTQSGKGKVAHKPRAAVAPVGPLPILTGADVDDSAQLEALLTVKSFLDPEGVLNDAWTEATGGNRGYCKWRYVVCDKAGEVVVKVNLTTDSYVMVLTGSLPPAAAFAGLPGLREIDIRMNALKGGLPDDWSELSGQLEVIRLDQNFINGTLPESWSQFGHLKQVTLWDNELVGTLPDAYADLVNLEVLDLSYNNLEGPLPQVWSSIGSQGTGLRELFLDVNQLTGPLPESYSAFTHLEKLLLSENQLTGLLPDIGAAWENIKEIWAEYNGFEGPLPESWGKMTRLEKLALNDNSFKGTIPASWANMKSLVDLYLYNNLGLAGCIPASIKTSLEISPGFAIEDFVMEDTSLSGFC